MPKRVALIVDSGEALSVEMDGKEVVAIVINSTQRILVSSDDVDVLMGMLKDANREADPFRYSQWSDR